MKLNIGLLIFMVCFITACKDDVLPKPKAMLRLEYPSGKEEVLQTEHFSIKYNEMARLKSETNTSFVLDYPLMKGSIFVNYKEVNGNLDKLLTDAQKLSYEHVLKAEGIYEDPVVNEPHKVYGMYYEIKGDAASQSQFYVTDSTKHFVTGSLYFYAKPNYDSILPAAVYLQKDMRNIIESLRWKK
ncbi:gliding motility lipoprotein GldD [Arenibacter sp. BSSL-BM3]|uniref:Gliding motility lipoprotein GldD n=1 Tax=Arenibacter arenosicollis TaxID=2762274 RepID=A0ABR7QH31_9FLAO|nr:gliding motility lipoprotein GldD [Arenibacter arenosicollis]MBC8766511.1 gliding motility lipoprotein GldD [Arenibacter arenosicollis]